MRSRITIGAVLLGALAAAAGLAAADADVVRGERIGVEVDVQRAGEATFTCRTTVRDLPTGTVLAAPQVDAREGATAIAYGSGAGFEVEVQIVVGAAGEKLDHVVLVRRGGALTSSQSVTLRFDR
jgi:hypothetical protein